MTQGERLREAMRDRGVKTGFLAEQIGVTPNYITMLGGGQRPITDEVGEKLARILKIRKEWLLTGDGEMEPAGGYYDQLAGMFQDLLAEDPDSFKIRFMTELVKLPPDAWKTVEDFINTLAK